MRICKLIPAIVAVIVILCSPFSSMPLFADPPHSGLICYCCIGKNCTMLSCSKCKIASFTDSAGSASEIILESFNQLIVLQPACGKRDTFQPPGTVYIEVPVKPPNSV